MLPRKNGHRVCADETAPDKKCSNNVPHERGATKTYAQFGRPTTLGEGSMVLRDASGVVVDSLNYGGLVDPWAAEGYQGTSGLGKSGCYVTTPGSAGGFGLFAPAPSWNTSAGRYPDGRDTDNTCTDFATTPATVLSAASAAGATNVKVASVKGFAAGETIRIDSGAKLENAIIATVGTAGATSMDTASSAGATVVHVASTNGFNDGQAVTIGAGTNVETVQIAYVTRWDNTMTLAAPLHEKHAAGTQVSGTGITLRTRLTREHATEVPVTGAVSTPGAPNDYATARP